MLALDDPRWRELDGGYRVPYDASLALRALEAGQDVWAELWTELHHQGDLGIASYAALPQLVRIAATAPVRDWNLYGLVATIEIERHRKTNPVLPAWLEPAYRSAWEELLRLALKDLRGTPDTPTLRALLGVVAIAHRQLPLGALLNTVEAEDIGEYLEERYGWSNLYSLDGTG